MRHSIAIASLLIAACSAEQSDPDCETAVQHVTSCYGDEVGGAFAEACTPESAKTALEEACPTAEGKEDNYNPPLLTPAVEQFKYGSIGADKMGLPVSIIKALPVMCRDLLPAGTDPFNQPLRSFGFNYEAGRELPIGFSIHRVPMIGTKLAGTNCAACHNATVRATPGGPRTAYMGAPNTRFDLEAWNNFLFNCITDPARFNSHTLKAAFLKVGVTGFDAMLPLGSSFIRSFVADLEKKVRGVVTDGPWGPGRDDAIGLSAATLLGEEFLPTIAAPVDFPSVWNQNARKGHALHWDGAAGTAFERNVLVSVGAGTPKNLVPFRSIEAIQSYIDTLAPPKYPFAINQTLAAKGKPLFDAKCLSCHGGSRTWQVVPLAEIGTDSARLDSVSQAGIDKINSLSGAGWTMDNFKKTNGYLNSLLDGVWLRAPYLHNGSVATLRDLLLPPAQRAKTFYRGNDLYDQAAVGFVSAPTDGAVLIDTSRQGNGNGGHVYGTDMTEADRTALLEYLKTL
ncbi:MAG: cytochrome c [Myxococcota bacterium]|nr:cytochrome c [Myxococcota bacterium]